RARRIRRLRPGVRVIATGPFGALTARRRIHRRVLLLAGGIGVTPLRALFEALPGGPGDITMLYRASSLDALVLRSELEEIAQRRQARLHYLLGRSGEADDPRPADHLRGLVPATARHGGLLGRSPAMT